jgi:hypothetical protein
MDDSIEEVSDCLVVLAACTIEDYFIKIFSYPGYFIGDLVTIPHAVLLLVLMYLLKYCHANFIPRLDMLENLWWRVWLPIDWYGIWNLAKATITITVSSIGMIFPILFFQLFLLGVTLNPLCEFTLDD